MKLSSDDSILYYATGKSLIKLDLKTKQHEVLFDELDGKKFISLNAIAIDEDNQMLYVTDAGRVPLGRFATKEVMMARRDGRIIKYDLKQKKVQLFLNDLAFPNGIVY